MPALFTYVVVCRGTIYLLSLSVSKESYLRKKNESCLRLPSLASISSIIPAASAAPDTRCPYQLLIPQTELGLETAESLLPCQ